MSSEEPVWLERLRAAAKQRPRTQFQKIRWADLQQLLRQRDYLLESAADDVKGRAWAMGAEDYGRP